MKEEEAKTKWCPMARVATVVISEKLSVVANRDISLLMPTNSFDPATDLTKCIASACMMWQWETRLSSTMFEEDGNTPRRERKGNDGYCGLARRPL